MADNTKKTSDSDPKSPGTRPFQVEELDDAALEGVSGGTGDTNNGCNFAAGCGVAPNTKGTSS